MGRSSGGGGHSGGGFGGGHSSGGFSGRGRNSGSGFNRPGGGTPPRGGFYSRPPRHYHSGIHVHVGRPMYGPPIGGSGGGLGAVIILFIIMFILIMFSGKISNNGVPQNTKQRTALSGVAHKTEWYTDNIGWITNKGTLVNGLEEFYNQTGIQPYVLFVSYSPDYWNGDNINVDAAQKYLEKVYDNIFKDEAHFIFAYFECKNDTKSEMDGEFRYLSGYSADTIMDDEAIKILWGYFNKNYYNTSLSIEEMISNTFSQTAKSIMSAPTNGWDFAKVLVGVIGIIIVVFIIYKILKNKNKREKEKEEYTKQILNQPLDTFGNDTSDLEDKYK